MPVRESEKKPNKKTEDTINYPLPREGRLDLTQTRIRHNEKPYSIALKNIQGNILKGHDRNEAILLFLKFEGPRAKVKRQIATFAKFKDVGIPGTITSASLQLEEFELFHNHKIPGGTFVNFFLTANGYEYLGFSKKGMKDKNFDENFINGMQKSQKNLNDPDPRFWDTLYQKPEEIHGMLLVADDEKSHFGPIVQIIREKVLQDENRETLASIVGVEHASQLRNDQEQPIEHFGFRDGITNPLFLESDKKNVSDYGGQTEWVPWAPLEVVLDRDPLVEGGYGSYMVFRKLEQHVRLFETIIRNFAADTLGLNPESEEGLEKARALIMGRFRDGTPVELRDTPYSSRYVNENYNNFTYQNDPSGTQCPFHAHIRKMNPRSEPLDEKVENQKDPRMTYSNRSIVRRGMTYGERNTQIESQGLSHVPNNGVGLLFLCFQRNIKEQFEYLQEQMANNADFPEKMTGLDPIAGQFDSELKIVENSPELKKQWNSSTPPPQQWPTTWGRGEKRFVNALQSCVTLKGGEYFFAPSIVFLREIERIKEF